MTSHPDLRGLDGATPRGYEGFEGVVAPGTSGSTPWWPAPQRAPEKAPNVVVVLVDDLGFSDTSPFGSEIATPALQALAETGYRFSNFRVTPLCAPSRAALLTGANPHRAGFGMVPHMDPGYPGVRMALPDDLPTLAETFRGNGYATLMVGKWHLTAEARLHDGADKSSWPLQRGFDRYFGSMEGCTTLYHPHRIVRDNSPITEQFAADDYLTDRLTDEAIGMISAVRAGNGTKPFFLYFSHHAVHGPVQAKPAEIDKHRGAYQDGWTRLRQERFARQKELGIFGAEVRLAQAGPIEDDGVPSWEELNDEQKALFARHMEVYAASVASVDESLAKLVDFLEEIGERDNTIIVFTSDNGGTGEGGVHGTRSYFSQFVFDVQLPKGWVRDVPRPLEDLGGPRVHSHYPRGWAHASNTPFRHYKGSVFEGGVHSPLIINWPTGLPRNESDDGFRRGFGYITDLAPTLIELAGIQRPDTLNGKPVRDADGHSLVPALQGRTDDAEPGRGQYITVFGNRAYYEGRFKLVAAPARKPGPPLWRLYDIEADPTEMQDIAQEQPELVAKLAEKWRLAAWNNTVFPLPDEPTALATLPSTILELSQPVTLRPGTPTLERYRSARLTALRSFTVEVTLGDRPGEGVLFSHGDQGGGYLVYIEHSRLHLSYNAYGTMHRADAPLQPSARTVTVSFTALPDLAWRITLHAGDTEPFGLDSVPMLVGMAPFTGISAGFDGGGPVDWDVYEHHGTFPYSGELRNVRYVPGEKAPYDQSIVVAIDEVSARLLD